MDARGKQRVDEGGSAQAKRTCFLDVLNVIACFAVVMLHCSNPVFDNVGDGFWSRCVVVQSAFIFAVPVFFMISGANLLGYRKRYDTKTFLKKRLVRILPTFIGCSVLFYVLDHLKPLLLGQGLQSMSVGDFALAFMTNGINDIFWFFYTIIGIYLITPLLSRIADDASLLRYGIVICFVTSSAFPLIERFLPYPGVLSSFTYPFFSIWLMYYLLGYYLVHHFDRQLPIGALAAAFVICIALCAVVTIQVNSTSTVPVAEPYDSFFSNVWCPLESIAISALFLIGKQFDHRIATTRIASIARTLSGLSLGIYGIHMIPLRLANAYVGALSESLTIKPILVFALTALVVWLWKTILSAVKHAARGR